MRSPFFPLDAAPPPPAFSVLGQPFAVLFFPVYNSPRPCALRTSDPKLSQEIFSSSSLFGRDFGVSDLSLPFPSSPTCLVIVRPLEKNRRTPSDGPRRRFFFAPVALLILEYMPTSSCQGGSERCNFLQLRCGFFSLLRLAGVLGAWFDCHVTFNASSFPPLTASVFCWYLRGLQ